MSQQDYDKCPECLGFKTKRAKMCVWCYYGVHRWVFEDDARHETPLELVNRIIGQSRGSVS
jgi:hypothetical protein